MSEAKHTPGPSEYLKIKYAAPTGACKCGNCQLVPPEMLREWADHERELLAALRLIGAVADRKTDEFDRARAAIAKAEGRDPIIADERGNET